MSNERHVIVVTHDMDYADKYADRIISIKDGEITQKQLSESKVKVDFVADERKKKASDLNSVRILGKNSIKHRKRKLIPILIVLSLMMTIATLIMMFLFMSDRIDRNVNINYLEGDLIGCSFPRTVNASFSENVFSENDVKSIEDDFDVNEIVEVYNFIGMKALIASDYGLEEADVRQIKISDFFKNRVMANDIKGSFINNPDEIIIASDIAEKLFNGDCIGNKVIMYDNFGHQRELTVVGVNKTVNPRDTIYTYVCNEVFKDFVSEWVNDSFDGYFEVRETRTELNSSGKGGIKCSAAVYDGNTEIIQGKAPEDNEILVSSKILQLNDYKDFELLKTKDMTISLNGINRVHVSGVFEHDDYLVLLSKKLYDNIVDIRPASLDVYLENPSDIEKFEDYVKKNKPYETESNLSQLKDIIKSQSMFYTGALMTVGIILCIIIFSMLDSYTKLLVLERKKEIATIKCLGATNKNVMMVVIYDIFMVAVIASGIMMISIGLIIYAMPVLFPKVFGRIAGLGLNYPFMTVFLVAFAFIILIGLYTYSGLKKLVKSSPAELMTQF